MAKRLLALMLVLMMLLSVAPVQVLAMENDVLELAENAEVQDIDATVNVAEEIQIEIDAIVSQYGITADMTDDEIANQIFMADGETLYATMNQIEALKVRAAALTEEEFAALDTEAFGRFVGVLELLTTPMLMATTVTPLEGQVSVTDSQNTGKISGGTYTATAKGSLFSKKTNNITITNESAAQAKISFDYTIASASSFTVDGAAAAASGSYSKILNAGESIAISITSNNGLSNTTVTLTMTNITYAVAASESSVTFSFDSNYGSVTAGGAAVANGDVMTVSLTDGVDLAATANGSTFLGWVNTADNSILSTAASYHLTPSEDMTVMAVFAVNGGTPWFSVGAKTQKSVSSGLLGMSKIYYYEVGATQLFNDLNAAAQAAAPAGKTLVLQNNAVLSAGDYTIPAGVGLLIPFDAANTMYTTQVTNTTSYSAPKAYRTLTMANGANLTVNGTVSLSAVQRCAQGSKADGGSPTGNVSFINMNGGSSITINNGGALYVYGFITGSGSITAYSGATIYENFQIMDFRGGTQSTDMQNGVFPLSQYYIQNIEVPTTLYSGAKEYAYTTIYMSSTDFGSAVNFIGPSGAMFNLTSGYVVKDYDESTDRLIVESYGDMTISPISMEVGTSDINSKDYELPINNNLTVKIHNGTITMGQDIAMLPGSRIEVGSDAKITLGSGVNVYVYDADEWGNYTFGLSSYNTPFKALTYVPGRTYVRTDADLADATIIINGICDASGGYVYTTAGGANITSDKNGTAFIKPGTQTVTYQFVQGTKGPGGATLATSGYVEIPLTTAKLKNPDGTYVETGVTSGTYVSNNGSWVKEVCSHEYNSEVTKEATCAEPGIITYTCKDFANCGSSYTEETPVSDHSYNSVVTEPTCTTTGYTTYTCSVCGDSYVADETPMADHRYEGVVTDPDCDEAGYTTYTCTVCGDTYVGDEVEATGHSYNAVVTAPDCSNGGYTTYTCAACGDTYVGDVVDALGHKEGEETIENNYDPDCDTEGRYDTVVYCAVCNAEISRVTTVVPADGHSYEAVVTEPTCTEAGYTTYTCSVCGDTYTGDEVEAAGHDYEAVTTEPGCVENGSTVYTCSVCGHSYDEEITASGHNYEAVVTEPTCTEAGYTTYTCSACGDTYTGDEVESTGHNYESSVTEPSCTEAGSTVYTCSACGDSYSEEIPALYHKYEAVVTAPTCTEVGYTTYTCSVCGDTYTGDEVEAAGHDYESVVIEPTCTDAGYTTYTCFVCGDTYTADEVEAIGHAYGDYTYNEATGKFEAACANNCGIPATKDACTVTFMNGMNLTKEVVEPGKTVAEPAAPEKEGFTFDGWFYGGVKYDFTTPVNGNIILVAQFTENVTEAPVEIPYQFTTSITASLELESEVFLNVAPILTDLEGKSLTTEQAQAIEGNVGMLLWDAATAPAEADATYDVCDNIIQGAVYNTVTGRFDIRSAGIAAKNLGDSLTIRAFYKDGDQIIYGKYVASYSPKTYCYNQIKKGAATKDVCIALLNYGAAAQTYFNYNTENMMNADLTAAQQGIAWSDDLVRSTWTVDSDKQGGLIRQNPPVNSVGGTLELEGAINVVFSGGASSITVDKAQLLIWDEATFNAVDVLTVDNATEVVDMTHRADGKYEYIYTGVPAKAMFESIYACQMYTDVDGNVYYGGVVAMCAERYGYMNYNKADAKVANLAKAMIVYGAAARDYFG